MKKKILFLASLLLLASYDTALAASSTGYIELNGSVNPNVAGTHSGVIGDYNLPSKGDVTVSRINGHWSVWDDEIMPNVAPASTDLKPAYTALGYNPLNSYIPGFYHQIEDGATPGSMTFEFPRPTSKIAILLYDIDEADVVDITARDADGNLITDLSGWTLLASGDATTQTTPGTDPAVVSVFDPVNGTLTSGEAGPTINSNREFNALQPNVPITELTMSLSANGINDHVYYSFYSLLEEQLSIGNLVWHDANNNGVVDGDEEGLTDVEVELYDSADTLIDTTTTDSNGNYLFDDLDQGDYYVTIAGDNFAEGGALEGYSSSDADGYEPISGPGFVNDEDSGEEAANLIANGVSTDIITLVYENLPVNDGDTLNSTALNIDFGFYVPEVLAETGVDSTQAGFIGLGIVLAVSATLRSVDLAKAIYIYKPR